MKRTLRKLEEFTQGFAEETGLSYHEAGEKWEEFSRQLSKVGRKTAEARGHDGGHEQGRAFLHQYGKREIERWQNGKRRTE